LDQILFHTRNKEGKEKENDETTREQAASEEGMT
jgi:hypothetical protein